NNGQALSITRDPRPRYNGERLLRDRPKIYRQVVRLLGEGWSANKICKWCHVTRETVRAISHGSVQSSAKHFSTLGTLPQITQTAEPTSKVTRLGRFIR